MREYKVKGDGFITKKATAVGGGGHVMVPKEWIGSPVVVILNGDVKDEKEVSE